MKRVLATAVSIMSHRLLLPTVCVLFLFLYIAVAFFTDEALVTLIQLIGHNPLALVLLALVAMNALLGLIADIRSWRIAGKAAAGLHSAGTESNSYETLAVSGRLDTDETARILSAEGYQVTVREGFVAARRGWSLLLPRMLWRLTICLLFVGVALSLSLRQSQRVPLIEGEALQIPGIPTRTVERITLEDVPGHWFLQRRLAITLAGADGQRDNYGIYPPGLLGPGFLYPRYLAVAPLLRITEPGIGVSEGYQLIMLYPPGREDVVALSGDYRLKLVILTREGMADPFASGRFDLHVRLLKGDQLLFEGDVPFGGRFESSGFAVELLDASRYVVTDFVNDYGVLCIWMACVAALLAVTLYLPLRFLWPHRFMFFSIDSEKMQIVSGCSSEGKSRQNKALYYDLLDKICREESRNR